MKKAWLSLVVSTCIVGSVVAFGYTQEFPEDELVEEQAVVIAFRTGLLNKGKIRQIYKHTRQVITGWQVERKPVYGNQSHLYTYLPHPVVVVQPPPKIIKEPQPPVYKVLPQVGVTSPSGTAHRSSHRRRHRR
jgi:hypothetical protein